MGKIAEAIEKEEATLELLANYLGMLPSLMDAIDKIAKTLSPSFATGIWLFCKERARYRQSVIDRLDAVKTDSPNQGKKGLFLIYPDSKYFVPDSGYDLPMTCDVQRHFQEYAASYLPKGYALKLIEFKPDEYFEWLGEKKDSESARQVWMIKQSVELAATA